MKDGRDNIIAPLPWQRSLSARFFALTLLSILVIEAVIFLPSVSSFRNMWLEQRAEAGRLAALALEAAPSRMVSKELRDNLLESAELLSVSEIQDDMRVQLLAPPAPIKGTPYHVDLMDDDSIGRLLEVLGTPFAPDDRLLVVTAKGPGEDRLIEYVVPQAPLKRAVQAFTQRIAFLSLTISACAGLIMYLTLLFTVVRPLRRVTRSVEQFRENPESWTRRLPSTQRGDEIGRAQNALADMEEAVAESFRQRKHLADLGTAVAKINHDLRNSLASAQIISDTMSQSQDPRVAKSAPRLERALQRAIQLATDTLDYGKAQPQAPQLELTNIHSVLREAAMEALGGFHKVHFNCAVPPSALTMADPEHLHRLLANLIRNAAEAMDGQSTPQTMSASLDGEALLIRDTGPGIPDSVRASIFTPFKTTRGRNGSGLGLVIAKELAEGMGFDLSIAETGPRGTTFRITMPLLDAVPENA